MRRLVSVCLALAIPVSMWAQQVIENTEGPADSRAGRVLRLEKELAITDEQDGFYFKGPRNLQVAPDGGIFIQDEDQLLKFDASGRFQKNLFRKGQGPGEVEQITSYIFAGDQIVVLQAQPNKVVLLDMQGEFLREFKPEEAVFRLFALYDGRYFGANNSRPQFNKLGDEPAIIDINWNIKIVASDGGVETMELDFPVLWYAQRIERAVISNFIVNFMARPLQEKYLVISHTQEYLLKLLDLESGEVIREFSRDYDRIRMKPDKTGKVETRPGTYTLVPPVDHYNDIQRFFVLGDRIWVMTSTLDTRKGFLVDVFDEQGRYLDNFYLPLQGKIKLAGLARHPITISGEFVYLIEYGEDDIPALVKYRIID